MDMESFLDEREWDSPYSREEGYKYCNSGE